MGLGLGPMALVKAGLQNRLEKVGNTAGLTVVHRQKPFTNELEAIEEINKNLALAVRAAVSAGEFPLVLAGDCNSSIGTLGGLGLASIGVVWLDAHGDFNTPETSPSGYFDGMPLAILTGSCYRTLWNNVTALPPIPESRVALIGARDLDPKEKIRLRQSQIKQVAPTIKLKEVYLHIDLDVLDPLIAPCNAYQAANGLSLADVLQIIRLITSQFRIRAAALTAFDPAFDVNGRTRKIGMEIANYLTSQTSG